MEKKCCPLFNILMRNNQVEIDGGGKKKDRQSNIEELHS